MSELSKEFQAKKCANKEVKCPFVGGTRICSDLLTNYEMGQNSSFKIKENSIYECHQNMGYLTLVKTCSSEEKCNNETNECMAKSHDTVRATTSLYGFNPQRHIVIMGHLTLVQEGGFIEITGKIKGLNFNSSHALNVHETGSVSVGSKCKDTGPPFNPEFTTTTTASFLGNIRTDPMGEALIDLRIPAERVCLIAWTKYNILNRSLVVYSNGKLIDVGSESDKRIACGLIEPRIYTTASSKSLSKSNNYEIKKIKENGSNRF